MDAITDKETGEKLYGYSQISLEKNNTLLQRLITIIVVFGTLGLTYILWLTWYVIHFSVINNIVSRCV